MRPQLLLSSLLLLAPLSTAWQPLEAVKREIAPLLPRQKSTPSTTHATSTEGKSTTTAASSSSSTGKSVTATSGQSSSSTTGKSTEDGKSTDKSGTSTAKSDAKSTGNATITSYETTKTFNPELPAGGVQMLTPNTITDPTQYYRINEPVTFAWNYTSLKATPSAVDVLVSCSENSATYTVSTNMPVSHNGTQAVVWDTEKYASQTLPLVMATYTLVIYDAAKAVTALPQAGYLGTYDQFYFGMYYGQQYTPIPKYECATCSGASMERVALGFVFGMAALTVVSFGWLGGVVGIW